MPLVPPAAEAQRRAIIVNLERLRWLPRQLPADRIWVNIPTARLELYRDNRPVFTTRVVVGETDKQTPELKTAITSVLFNPSWYVPRSIVTEGNPAEAGARSGLFGAAPHGHAAGWRESSNCREPARRSVD